MAKTHRKRKKVSRTGADAPETVVAIAAMETTESPVSFLRLENIEGLETTIEDALQHQSLRGEEAVVLRTKLEAVEHTILNTEQRLNVFKKHVREMLTALTR